MRDAARFKLENSRVREELFSKWIQNRRDETQGDGELIAKKACRCGARFAKEEVHGVKAISSNGANDPG